MKKILIFFILFFSPFSVFALTYPELNSKVVEIYDLDEKKVLYEVHSNEVTSIASLTKIATSIVAIEMIHDINEEVVITYDMLKTVDPDASVAGLRVGDHLTYKDLLYASLLPSGADATNSLAILTCDDIDSFVVKMNELAVKLNMQHTHFMNTTGLDQENHFSNANDIQVLLEYALNNPTFKEIFTTKEYTMSNGLVVKSTLYKYNTHPTLMNDIIGSKTGFTYAAGYCLASLSNINGHNMMILLLNAGKNGRDFLNIADTSTLITYLREHYHDELLLAKDTFIQKIPIQLSKEEEFNIYLNQDITKYLPDDYDKALFKIDYDGLDEIDYHTKKNDKIGTVTYTYDDEVLYEQDIFLNQELHYDILKIIQKHLGLILSCIFGFIVLIMVLVFVVLRMKKNKH